MPSMCNKVMRAPRDVVGADWLPLPPPPTLLGGGRADGGRSDAGGGGGPAAKPAVRNSRTAARRSCSASVCLDRISDCRAACLNRRAETCRSGGALAFSPATSEVWSAPKCQLGAAASLLLPWRIGAEAGRDGRAVVLVGTGAAPTSKELLAFTTPAFETPVRVTVGSRSRTAITFVALAAPRPKSEADCGRFRTAAAASARAVTSEERSTPADPGRLFGRLSSWPFMPTVTPTPRPPHAAVPVLTS